MKQVEAREEALGALYAADSRGLDEIDFTKISKRAAALAEGTWEAKESIDEAITAASTKWRIERMPIVDRNILRLGVYELRTDTLPIAVVISQAVELAKKFSTAKSSAFVNGVLSGVAKSDAESSAEPAVEQEPPDTASA